MGPLWVGHPSRAQRIWVTHSTRLFWGAYTFWVADSPWFSRQLLGTKLQQ